MIDRTDRVIAALGRRISEQGDMHIRVSRHTVKVLLRALDLGQWHAGEDDFREVDALALEAIRHLAWKARASRPSRVTINVAL